MISSTPSWRPRRSLPGSSALLALDVLRLLAAVGLAVLIVVPIAVYHSLQPFVQPRQITGVVWGFMVPSGLGGLGAGIVLVSVRASRQRQWVESGLLHVVLSISVFVLFMAQWTFLKPIVTLWTGVPGDIDVDFGGLSVLAYVGLCGFAAVVGLTSVLHTRLSALRHPWRTHGPGGLS